MKLRLIKRIYRQHLEWERNMSKNVSLLEVIILFTIVVCITLKYAPLLERLEKVPESTVKLKDRAPVNR